MPPTRANGKICYVEMPANDIARSADFYKAVFGWNIRQRGDGATAFDDGVGEVSGAWVQGRPSSPQPGLLIYIMVDSVEATIKKVSQPAETSCSRWARMHLKLPPASPTPEETFWGCTRSPSRQDHS